MTGAPEWKRRNRHAAHPTTAGTVVFHVPVVELGLILLGSYLATLLTT